MPGSDESHPPIPIPSGLPEDAAGQRWSPSGIIRLSVGFHLAVFLAIACEPALLACGLGALALNHVVLGAIGMIPRSRLLGHNLTALPEASARRGEIALTFDDGPDPAVTPYVLDLLDRFDAKASFFCIGQRILAEPALARDIIRRGHSIENHTFSHPFAFACYPPARLRREIEAANDAIVCVSGRRPAFFRAPMGLRSPFLDPLLASLGQRLATWTCRGYDGVEADPGRVLRRLMRGVKAGGILLLHDGACARTPAGEPVVCDVLPVLLERISDAGLRAVSLPTAFANADESVSKPTRFQKRSPAEERADDEARMHPCE